MPLIFIFIFLILLREKEYLKIFPTLSYLGINFFLFIGEEQFFAFLALYSSILCQYTAWIKHSSLINLFFIFCFFRSRFLFIIPLAAALKISSRNENVPSIPPRLLAQASLEFIPFAEKKNFFLFFKLISTSKYTPLSWDSITKDPFLVGQISSKVIHFLSPYLYEPLIKKDFIFFWLKYNLGISFSLVSELNKNKIWLSTLGEIVHNSFPLDFKTLKEPCLLFPVPSFFNNIPVSLQFAIPLYTFLLLCLEKKTKYFLFVIFFLLILRFLLKKIKFCISVRNIFWCCYEGKIVWEQFVSNKKYLGQAGCLAITIFEQEKKAFFLPYSSFKHKMWKLIRL